MVQLKTIKRVTIYADLALEQSVIRQCLSLGAHGYTIVECRGGKGVHDVLEDPFSGQASRISIELLVDPEVAEKIVAFFSSERFDKYAILVCMENVQVATREHY
jgi:hypothetical protein